MVMDKLPQKYFLSKNPLTQATFISPTSAHLNFLHRGFYVRTLLCPNLLKVALIISESL